MSSCTFFDADGLSRKDLADIDLFLAQTDATTPRDHDGFVVEGILEIRQARVGPWGRVIDVCLAGRHAMMMYVELDPGVEVPTHSHPHEQLGLVIEGELDFWIAGETRRTYNPVPATGHGHSGGEVIMACYIVFEVVEVAKPEDFQKYGQQVRL